MVCGICSRGDELAKQLPKKSVKIDQLTKELRAAASRLRQICEERTRRLQEAGDLVKWGQLVDEAFDVARRTEGQLMSDDYQMDEQGLKRLLEKHEVRFHRNCGAARW